MKANRKAMISGALASAIAITLFIDWPTSAQAAEKYKMTTGNKTNKGE